MFKYIIFLIQPIAAEPVFILCLKGLFKFWLVTALTGLSKHLPTMCTYHRLCWRRGWVWWLYSYDVTTWSYKRHSLGMSALYIQCFPHNSFWGRWVISRLTLNRKGCITINAFPGGMQCQTASKMVSFSQKDTKNESIKCYNVLPNVLGRPFPVSWLDRTRKIYVWETLVHISVFEHFILFM